MCKKIQRWIIFQIHRYSFGLLIKLAKIIRNKNRENTWKPEIVNVALGHCNFVNNEYWQEWTVHNIFIPNTVFGKCIEETPSVPLFIKTYTWILKY